MDPAQLFSPATLVAALAALALLAVVITAAITRRAGNGPAFERRRTLLEPEELAVFGALQEAAGERAVVLTRVPMAAVLDVNPKAPRRVRKRGQRQLEGRQFDFLLCEPGDLRPLVAVELDRGGRDRRSHSARLSPSACESAHLGLVQIEADGDHSPERLRAELRPWLERRHRTGVDDLRPDGRREPILDLPED